MRRALVVAVFASAWATPRQAGSAFPDPKPSTLPREARVRVGKADLYSREIGQGQPVIVLHGGPDFDHRYLLPEMDRLADSLRLIYYDQRGRGRSGDRVRPEDVTLESEMGDLDTVRRHFGLGSVAILGHSWGTVLALEYAIRHPDRVSHLILMNPAPASNDDFMSYRKERREKSGGDLDQLKAMASTVGYQEGDPDAVTAYYRIHFKTALARRDHFERVITSLRASFTREGILKAREIEKRLLNETWLSDSYDLHPKLERLSIPTLVIYGDHDMIPAACAAHIARAIPKAHLVTLKDCGHFSYLECPDAVRKDIQDFFQGAGAPGRSQ
ncbi:MAG TPA: alpha/beta fold hydrolase [Vicinamibacteria bacterium]|nr:alpha/beta fold hydrolase [Vicinamibacteria bacterium]